MPSKEGMIRCFWMMLNSGLSKPATWRSTKDEGSAIESMALAYCQILADLSDEQVYSAAVVYCRQSAAYWPTAGQLLAIAPGASATCAITDWGLVVEATRRAGPTDLPDCKGDIERERAIRAGIRGCGGIDRLDDMTDQRVHSMRHAFIAGYEAYINQMRDERSRKVMGLAVGPSLLLSEGNKRKT